jgi:c-di-GMP phosphodiesterase
MSAQEKSASDEFIFKDQALAPTDTNLKSKSNGVWRILIVDDEPEVHKITAMALSGVEILGRNLEFLNAKSSAEARKLLEVEKDIAVILLDVVMESDNAGLELVEIIRDELQLESTRIILRTGQPGHAPEEKVIIDYDINDYIMKTEMTRNKLVTAMCAAIRGYQQIELVTQAKNFLEKLNETNSYLISQNSFQSFVRGLVNASLELFQSDGDGMFIFNTNSNEPDRDQFSLVFATKYSEAELKIEKQQFGNSGGVTNIKSNSILQKCIKTQKTIIYENDVAFFIPSKSSIGILLLEDTNLSTIPKELLESYVNTISSGLDSSLLLERISDIAFVDPLTTLPNRTRFIQVLDKLYHDQYSTNDTAVLLDLEHFSDINDGLGQDAGNQLLIAVANRLVKDLSQKITIARVGSDVYGLVGPEEDLERRRLLNLFSSPFLVGESSISINVNIGMWYRQQKQTSGLDLLKQANIALNLAKKDDQNRAIEYLPEMEDETSWRLHMIRRLTEDFSKNKLQVWYQPQIILGTEEIVGAEALLRWPDGKGGFISPLTFIPLAEYSGLINQIGSWVLDEACQEVNKVAKLGYREFRIAVNVSVPQFKNPHFVEEVIQIVEKHGVKPSQIELEITESVVMDDTNMVIEALKQLRNLGFTVAIDDFGTGFSSLSYLHKLPLNRLKIDREFIRNIGKEGEGVLAETIISLGQKLGLVTIAEGIETQFQQDYVTNLGCNESQGFFHAKPMPSEELHKFLINKSHSK